MSQGAFIITDGNLSVDMLKTFSLVDWTPATPPIKGEGTWRSSPFTQGRQQVLRQYGNVIDNTTWIAKGKQSIDQLIRNTQDLRRLLEKAAQYWLLEWQNEPVWIETRGVCETNTRYAVIHDYRAPGDDNPFAPPFTTSGIFNDFSIIFEHTVWQDTAPGSPDCVEISGTSQGWCYPHYLAFTEDGDEVDCGSDASIDDLISGGDMTIDGWILANDYGDGNARIADKSSWYLMLSDTLGLYVFADYDVTDAISYSGLDDIAADGLWHHIAAVWDNANTTWSLYIDGVEVSYGAQTAGNNNYVSDAADNLILGNEAAGTEYWSGYLGWLRLSDNQRFLADFDTAIPPRCKLPEIDGNTVAVWIYEGTGATADNLEGTVALDGTITGADWGCDCESGS